MMHSYILKLNVFFKVRTLSFTLTKNILLFKFLIFDQIFDLKLLILFPLQCKGLITTKGFYKSGEQ